MKFITFKHEGRTAIGAISKGLVYEIKPYKNMIDLIRNYEDFSLEPREVFNLGEVELLSPILNPVHDIICVGKNYEEHILELGHDLEKDFKASYFGKRARKIYGHGEKIEARLDLDWALDYEVELAVIIGKEAKDLEPDNVESHIFGYSIFNDLSSRTVQKAHGQWYLGKSIDGYSAMGPQIVTRDEIADIENLKIRSLVNGELRQNSNTSHMIMSTYDIVIELSKYMTLEAGDIISTGTPKGTAIGFKDPDKYLKSGDIITCEIENIGFLENTIL